MEMSYGWLTYNKLHTLYCVAATDPFLPLQENIICMDTHETSIQNVLVELVTEVITPKGARRPQTEGALYNIVVRDY